MRTWTFGAALPLLPTDTLWLMIQPSTSCCTASTDELWYNLSIPRMQPLIPMVD